MQKEINRTEASRRAVYRFLYQQRVSNPKTYFDRTDLCAVAEADGLEAALSFGLEMGHLNRYRKQYYRLTALGMLFAEERGWVGEE
jgi:hypothetical protein